MGLDMYLEAEVYVSGYSFRDEQDQALYRKLVELVGMQEIADPETPSATVRVTVAYWRKANAIHRWFVENVQEGKDDCGDYYVSREQLTNLRDLCRRVLKTAKVANGQPIHAGTTWYPDGSEEQHFEQGRAALNGEELARLLPTQRGFFFGGTDYDEWYLRDVESTIYQLERALKAESAEFIYHASW